MSYTVLISEAQRLALRAALLNAPLPALLAALPSRSSESALEVEALLDMLTDLPASEVDAPGCLHDLTA